MHAHELDAMRFFGQARVDERRALATREGLAFLATRGGRVRLRRMPCARGPRLLFATDGPNVVEHYDALLRAFEGEADVVVFDPPGTGGSAPARGFDFSIDALADACADVVVAATADGPRTLVFPCYTGFIARSLVARPALHASVERLVLPQTPSWEAMARWCDAVDRQRRLRTPVLGQLVMTLRRRAIAASWYRASTSDAAFAAAFTVVADEAFAVGGCFCLASLMQGLERSPPPPSSSAQPTAVVWGARDRSHKRSEPFAWTPETELVHFKECGHSPELEAPERFARWLLDWLAQPATDQAAAR